MHDSVYYIAATWILALIGIEVLLVIRGDHRLVRLLALDTVTLLLVAFLVLFSDSRDVGYYLDAALALALLSFIATAAAARFYGEGKVLE